MNLPLIISCLIVLCGSDVESVRDRRKWSRAWNDTSEHIVEPTPNQKLSTTDDLGDLPTPSAEEVASLRDAMAITYYPSRQERPAKLDEVSQQVV